MILPGFAIRTKGVGTVIAQHGQSMLANPPEPASIKVNNAPKVRGQRFYIDFSEPTSGIS
jgi:hypothetical protein